jgi:hypothetical protein
MTEGFTAERPQIADLLLHLYIVTLFITRLSTKLAGQVLLTAYAPP